MSDNTPLNPGAGPDQARALERTANIKTQVIAIDIGGVDGPEKIAGADNPMPVVGNLSVDNFPAQTGLTDAELRASPVLVEESGPLLTLFVRLLNLLGSPVGYDKSLQRSRQTAIIESGTVSNVTAVGVVTNQANIGGIQAQILPNAANLSAWQACVRSRIS